MPVKKGRKKVVAPDKEWAEMKRYMKEHNLTQQAFVQRMWDALKQSESNKQPYGSYNDNSARKITL